MKRPKELRPWIVVGHYDTWLRTWMRNAFTHKNTDQETGWKTLTELKTHFKKMWNDENKYSLSHDGYDNIYAVNVKTGKTVPLGGETFSPYRKKITKQ